MKRHINSKVVWELAYGAQDKEYQHHVIQTISEP